LDCYAFVTLKLYPNSHCKRYAKTSFDLQKDLVHAEFTEVQEVQVQYDAGRKAKNVQKIA